MKKICQLHSSVPPRWVYSWNPYNDSHTKSGASPRRYNIYPYMRKQPIRNPMNSGPGVEQYHLVRLQEPDVRKSQGNTIA